jgi:NTE family protein
MGRTASADAAGGGRATDTATPGRVRTAIVLGAGGTVGIGYHAGVLKALADAGLDPAAADLVVGTSAGAIVGSILRVGHDLDEVWELAHLDENPFAEDQPFFRPDVVFSQGWRTPLGLARRVVGSSWVLQRSFVRWPIVNPPRTMQRFYRAGLGSVTEQRSEFSLWAGEEWPEQRLALCSFDIVTGRRVVLGEDRPGRPPLPDAMRAAAAVPIVYPPVRLGRRLLVDGAVSSSTNVDVAVEAGAEMIIVAAPLAYDHDDKPALHLRAGKQLFDCRLERELAAAREAGVEVLEIRPNAEEAEVHGLNLLRSGGNGEVANLSHERTTAALGSPEGQKFRRAWRAANRSTARSIAADAASRSVDPPVRPSRRLGRSG